MGCDSPARECFTWHVLPKLPGAKHRIREDGSYDPYSVRVQCPAHDDHDPSLGISVVNDKIVWNCFVCKNRQKVRMALHRICGIALACLPLTAGEKQDVLDLIAGLVFADTDSHAEIRLRIAAAIEGHRDLPRGYELEGLADRASVSRGKAYAFRARPVPSTPNSGSRAGTQSLSSGAGQRANRKSPQVRKRRESPLRGRGKLP
jgi:hypothetical protein